MKKSTFINQMIKREKAKLKRLEVLSKTVGGEFDKEAVLKEVEESFSRMTPEKLRRKFISNDDFILYLITGGE